MRRFLVDVAWAMNGFEVAKREDLVFDWPQPGAVAFGGERAFGAFFRHQTRNRDDTRVLLSGARVATLLGSEAPAESCIAEDRLYVRPGAMNGPAKQGVWRLIQQLGEKA